MFIIFKQKAVQFCSFMATIILQCHFSTMVINQAKQNIRRLFTSLHGEINRRIFWKHILLFFGLVHCLKHGDRKGKFRQLPAISQRTQIMFVTKPFKTLLEELSDNKHLNLKNQVFLISVLCLRDYWNCNAIFEIISKFLDHWMPVPRARNL